MESGEEKQDEKRAEYEYEYYIPFFNGSILLVVAF